MKKIMLMFMIVLTMIFSGCSSKNIDEDLVEESGVINCAISQIDMEANGHEEQIHEYDSPYTICYHNSDGTYSMYIFASPIQYKSYKGECEFEFIDNTVIETDRENFAYENKANDVRTYFPKKLDEYFLIKKDDTFIEVTPNWDTDGFTEAKKTVFTNMYGDEVDAVIYEREDMDIALYPMCMGIKTELILKRKPVINEFTFNVRSSSTSYEDKRNGYILLKNKDENQILIYSPLVQYCKEKESQLDVDGKIKASESETNSIDVLISVNQSIIDDENTIYPIKLDSSFEIYSENIPDSTVYSRRTVNNYLANYAVVGNHPLFGEGWHYLRFRIRWIFQCDSNNIISAKYFMRPLSKDENSIDKISIFNVQQQWSSTNIKWDTRALPQDLTSELEGDYYDLTKFVQNCLNDETSLLESMGLIMKTADNTEEYGIYATSDNTLYPPYLLVKFNQIPKYFSGVTSINPVGF